MSMLLSLMIVLGAFLGSAGVFNAWRRRRRTRGALLPAGESVLREVEECAVRLYVNRSVPGGPRAPGGRDRARIVLSSERLILSTGHGRVVEICADRPGAVRCTGPRRLVVEGVHPSGRADVRAELAVADAEEWQAAANTLPGVRTQRARE